MIKNLIGEGFMQLKKNDILKGFIMAMLSVVVTYVGQCIDKGDVPMDAHTWVLELKIAFGAGLAYLLKNFFTSSDDKFLKVEPKKEA